MTDASDTAAQCQKLASMSNGRWEEVFRKCMCMVDPAAEPCVATRLASADQLAAPENGTEPEPELHDPADDNLINSDVFIYVIVFIVIVYFLTFLYLCMKKRQRDAADVEAGGGAGRSRRPRGADDRPPAYEDVVQHGAEGGGDKNSEPPTYAEVLARSQQLDKLGEEAEATSSAR